MRRPPEHIMVSDIGFMPSIEAGGSPVNWAERHQATEHPTSIDP